MWVSAIGTLVVTSPQRNLPAGIGCVGLAGLFRPSLVFLRGDIESTKKPFGRQFGAL
jgi:hypothetical protein